VIQGAEIGGEVKQDVLDPDKQVLDRLRGRE